MAALVLLPPSPYCGPFQQFSDFMEPITLLISQSDSKVVNAWNMITSKGGDSFAQRDLKSLIRGCQNKGVSK